MSGSGVPAVHEHCRREALFIHHLSAQHLVHCQGLTIRLYDAWSPDGEYPVCICRCFEGFPRISVYTPATEPVVKYRQHEDILAWRASGENYESKKGVDQEKHSNLAGFMRARPQTRDTQNECLNSLGICACHQ